METEGQIIPQDQPKLAYAESLVKKELAPTIDDEFIKEYLYQKLRDQKTRTLANFLTVGLERLGNPQKAIDFAAIIFEIEERKTDDIWGVKKLQETIAAGLKGQPVNLISMLCCINQYDGTGGYRVNPNLYAYLKDPKLEPIPLILNELIAVKRFFEFYGIGPRLTLYVPDTEYTEVKKFGLPTSEILENLEKYTENLRLFLAERDKEIELLPISSLTTNSSCSIIRAQVLEKVSSWRDQDFERKWYRKFEEDFERDYEAQQKRKVFPPRERRRQSLNVTRRRWAEIATEGSVFACLDPNTILLSTERRERDIIYTIDKDASVKFPPVIYILRAAEMWNRKLTGKID